MIPVLYSNFDYSLLTANSCKVGTRPISNAIIAFDTETSKSKKNEYDTKENKWIPVPNYVVAWSVAVRINHQNVACLYGHKPHEFIECVNWIRQQITGEMLMYAHNLAYDWQFLKHAMFQEWGFPTKFLATKPHNPINIQFNNGITLRDSLILAQRSLEKWAEDLDVQHKKAVGAWDYNIIRTQCETFTTSELLYIGNDVLALAESLDKTVGLWCGKSGTIGGLPYTATGKIRRELLEYASNVVGAEHLKDCFDSYHMNCEMYKRLERIYHGGYTHANRHIVGQIIKEPVTAYDFASSYPYCMIAKKFPTGAFKKVKKFDGIELTELLDRLPEDYTIIGTVIITNGCVRDDVQMPYLQESKCFSDTYDYKIDDGKLDNGRILSWDGTLAIDTTDISMRIIDKQYYYDSAVVINVCMAKLDYLPKWFRDFVWSKWQAKCHLKGKDEILYKISKSDVNSLYGMCVQKAVADDIIEDFNTGKYSIEKALPDICPEDMDRAEYNEIMSGIKSKFKKLYLSNKRKILPYVWGIYITEHAVSSLFELGSLCETWLYSDTDSCYGLNWNEEKLNEYNKKRKQELYDSGYGEVKTDSGTYYLGVAELDGRYCEFTTLGCKRYCVRKCDAKASDGRGELKITVAGVPKRAVESLGDDIKRFKKGYTFKGTDSGKLTHSYGKGNTCEGIDGYYWIDLNPCDYLLDETTIASLKQYMRCKEDVNI